MPEETAASAQTAETADTEQQTTTELAADQAAPAADASTPEPEAAAPAEPVAEEEISYHAVEKDGNVTAIWEMQGPKHLRTIAPRSSEGKHILSLFTSEHHEEAAHEEAA